MESVQDWFNAIYKEHYKRLLKTAVRIVKDQELAEDIVQNTFETLLLNYEKVRGYENIWGWLSRTLANKAMNEITRASNKREVSIETGHIPAANDPYEPDDLLSVMPPGLSEEDRRILYLRFEMGLHHAEIAEELGCSVEASRVRLARAKTHCQELLKKFSG